MINNRIVGAAIRELRKKANKTLRESAEYCNHTKSWLSDIESGRRAIDFSDAKALCTFYGYTLSDLSATCDTYSAQLEDELKNE